MSQSILGVSTHADITPGFKTDHSLITLSLSLHSNPRGNGFWKLNTSLLADNNFIETIKIAIQETANEYKDDKLVNPLLLWDMIKLKVREKSITYSAPIKKAKVKKEEELEKRLDNTCSNDPPVSQNVTERIKILKEELEKIIEYRTKGAILRSKSRWCDEGEKNTEYFLNLEKRHFKQGTISQLKLSDGVFVISDKDILSECESFYKDLYASKIDNFVNFDFFQQANETVLTPDELQVCDGLLTKTECEEALKCMNADKTPGTDGLPVEFYKAFWDDISTHVLSVLNFAF